LKTLTHIALFALLLASAAFGASDGGIFLRVKTVGIQPNMTVAESNPTTDSWGNVFLGNTIYTTFILTSLDSIYTGGVGNGSYTSPDSSGAVLGYLPCWEFVGTDCELSLFAMGTQVDSIRVTVEQAIHYSPLMADSGFAYGFQRTDTLFGNSIGTCHIVTASAQGAQTRQLYDTLRIRSPYIRFKIKNLEPSTTVLFYLYIRRQVPDIWQEGAAGRLNKAVRQ